MKKTIALLLVILLMFNFIFANSSYAEVPDPLGDMEANNGQDGASQDEDEQSSSLKQDAPTSEGAVAEAVEQGTVSRETISSGGDSSKKDKDEGSSDKDTVAKGSEKQVQGSATKVTMGITGFMKSAVGALLGILARIINVFFALQVDMLLAQLTFTKEGEGDGELRYWLTIERMVFNRVALLNVNYFHEGNYKVSDLTIQKSDANEAVKDGIARMYYACRILALSIGMIVLIYIGIRMAISTVASEQAKYKQMLVSWVESIILIFAMPYIMSAFFWFGEFLTGLFYDMEQMILGSSSGATGPGTYNVFEETVRNNSIGMTISLSGLTLTMYSIIYWCMLFLIVKFLWTYMKRLLMVGFLITISPLITITYAIDKVGDGKAQAFSTWMKEFVVNVLIQPLHALIYMVFVLTANQIAAKSPLVALGLLFSLGQVERMVKVIFDMKGLVSLRGVDKFLKKG